MKRVSFTYESLHIPHIYMNQCGLINCTQVREDYTKGLKKGWVLAEQPIRLGNAGVIGDGWLDITIKINFQGEGCCVENRPAMLAIADMALHVAPDFRGKPAF